MISLPSGCTGCPFEKYGRVKVNPTHFTPDTIVPGSTVLFIAQNPGEDEESGHRLIKRHWKGGTSYDEWEPVTPQPLIGATGKMFTERFLPHAGLQREDISIANALRCRPGKHLGLRTANDLPPITTTMKLERSKADIVKAMKHCRDTYLHVPSTVDTIVTMGRYAMFSLTGIQKEETEYGKKEGVMDAWRGYAVDYPHSDWGSHRNGHLWSTIETSRYHALQSPKRLFFTMHISALFQGRNKTLFGATLLDFKKIRRMRDGRWPEALPPWTTTPPPLWPSYSSFDTEYIPVGYGRDVLIRWSLCDTEYHLYCVEFTDADNSVIPIRPRSTIIGQNWLADKQHASTLVDLNGVNIEDMMLAHTVLNTGEPHNLNYIQSKYGTLNKHKHLHGDDPQLYSAIDAHQPMRMWNNYFLPTFRNDLLSWRYYKHYVLPLLTVYDKSSRTGINLNGDRLGEVQTILTQRLEMYRQRAREITGNPHFKLNAVKDMKEALYDTVSE